MSPTREDSCGMSQQQGPEAGVQQLRSDVVLLSAVGLAAGLSETMHLLYCTRLYISGLIVKL